MKTVCSKLPTSRAHTDTNPSPSFTWYTGCSGWREMAAKSACTSKLDRDLYGCPKLTHTVIVQDVHRSSLWEHEGSSVGRVQHQKEHLCVFKNPIVINSHVDTLFSLGYKQELLRNSIVVKSNPLWIEMRSSENLHRVDIHHGIINFTLCSGTICWWCDSDGCIGAVKITR